MACPLLHSFARWAFGATFGRLMLRADRPRRCAAVACKIQLHHHTLPCVCALVKHVAAACCCYVLLAHFVRPATAVGRSKVLHICHATGGSGGATQQHGQGPPSRAPRSTACGASRGHVRDRGRPPSHVCPVLTALLATRYAAFTSPPLDSSQLAIAQWRPPSKRV